MRRRFAWYCVYAIVLPIILLVVTITMDLSPAVPSTYLKPNFGVKGCWFKSKKIFIILNFKFTFITSINFDMNLNSSIF